MFNVDGYFAVPPHVRSDIIGKDCMNVLIKKFIKIFTNNVVSQVFQMGSL